MASTGPMKPLLTARERAKADREWLQDQLKQFPGYNDWNKMRHRTLPGSLIADYWEFAVRFMDKYVNTHCPSVGVVLSL